MERFSTVSGISFPRVKKLPAHWIYNLYVITNVGKGLKDGSTGLLCGCFSHNHPQITQLTTQLPDYILIRRDNSENDSLCKLIRVLISESQTHQNDSTYILNKLSETILALIFRDHLNVEKGLLAALAHPKLYVAISAMHSTPEEKWTVEMLANKVNMSRGSFSSLFKELVNMSPIEYLTQWRLSKAYRILAEEKQSILAVALQSGYDNESSFSKAFKRVMGRSGVRRPSLRRLTARGSDRQERRQGECPRRRQGRSTGRARLGTQIQGAPPGRQVADRS